VILDVSRKMAGEEGGHVGRWEGGARCTPWLLVTDT
jgi:hypothetical protein